MNCWARVVALSVVRVGMKWASLVSRQMITRIAVYGGFLEEADRAEGGSSVI